MGADIHCYIERRNHEKNVWEPLNLYIDKDGEKKCVNFFTDRDYELFGQLAGVRSMIDPFVYPRGLPDDISEFVENEYKRGEFILDDGTIANDFHSATWYDYVELKLYSEKEESAIVEDFDYTRNPSAYFVERIDFVLDLYWIFYPKPNDIRIVIWFDS